MKSLESIELAFGIRECRVQRSSGVRVSLAGQLNAVGVDLCPWRAHMNLYRVFVNFPVCIWFSFHNNMASCNSAKERLQPMTQIARSGFECAGSGRVSEVNSQCRAHAVNPDTQDGASIDPSGPRVKYVIAVGLCGLTSGVTGQVHLQLNQVSHRPSTHFLHDLGAMNFDSSLAEP